MEAKNYIKFNFKYILTKKRLEEYEVEAQKSQNHKGLYLISLDNDSEKKVNRSI